jgi:hypothetical protein
VTAWLAKNSVKNVSINAPTRKNGERRFDFFTIQDSLKARNDYLDNVVPQTMAIGMVDRKNNRGNFVSPIHNYIRMGNDIYEIDEGSNQVTKTTAKKYYEDLYNSPDQRIFHEFTLQANSKELAELKRFYDDFHKTNGFKYDIDNGFGEVDEDNKMKLHCITYSVLFAFPHLNKKYPLVQALVDRGNLNLFEKDPTKEPHEYPQHIEPKTFSHMLANVTGTGIVTLGHKAESRGNPEGLHWRSFLENSLVGKKFGVLYDQVEMLEPASAN